MLLVNVNAFYLKCGDIFVLANFIQTRNYKIKNFFTVNVGKPATTRIRTGQNDRWLIRTCPNVWRGQDLSQCSTNYFKIPVHPDNCQGIYREIVLLVYWSITFCSWSINSLCRCNRSKLLLMNLENIYFLQIR